MSARRLRLVTPEDAHEAAREQLIREALKLARKLIDHDLRGHKTINIGAGHPLVAAAKELLP